MNYNDVKKLLFNKLGTHKIMALATSVNDNVMIRNVSCIIYNEKIYFKTDKNFNKTKQLLMNNKVALCFHGVALEGIAQNKGLVIEEKDLVFENKYQEYWDKSYNAYSHKENEILIEVIPVSAEIWDQDERDYAFQTLINFENEEIEILNYD